MIRNFLLATLRNLLRHKVQSLVNIASLALGLAIFGFAFLYVKQQLSYNLGWPDAERIHRLVVEQRGIPGRPDGEFATVVARAWPQIVEQFASETDTAVRIYSTFMRIKDTASQNGANLFFVDPAFSELFPLDVVAGNLERVLGGPGFIALEETLASALGPDIGPGTRLTLLGQQDEQLEFEIAAIYRLPANRSPALDFRVLTLIHEYAYPLFGERRQFTSWENSVQVWLKLKPGIGTDAFNALQPAFIQNVVTAYDEALGPERRISDHLFYRWQPLPEIHFSPIGFEAGTSGNPARVTTFAVVGLLVLLIGCSNSVSLSLASAIERRKEIGIRKAAGALRHDIMVHYVGESALVALIALVGAIVLLETLLPAFQTLMPFRVALDAGVYEYLLLTLVAVLVGLGNGVYPALVLSSVRPQAVLKPGAGTCVKTGQSVRGLLVGTQFCFASMLLIGTAALYLQLAVTRAQPLGFNPDNLVFVFFPNSQNGPSAEVVRQEAEKIPGVVGATAALTFPAADRPLSTNSWSLINKTAESGEVKAQAIPVSDEFLKLVQIPLLAGRDYDLARDTMNLQAQQDGEQPRENVLIVNRTAARALGFATPGAAIDQLVYYGMTDSRNGQFNETPIRIIGVVEDNMYGSLRRRPGPEVYVLAQVPNVTNVLLKYDAAAESSLQQNINEVAQRLFGAPAQAVMFTEAQIESAFRQEQNESKLLLICGGLALLLACIGLYGLAAFSMERCAKEVGVRKVMGADVGSLVALFLWRFSWPILLANVIAWPVAVYFVMQWIERFPYQLDKSWLLPLCLCASLVILLISILTVSSITAKAARTNPIQSLRYE